MLLGPAAMSIYFVGLILQIDFVYCVTKLPIYNGLRNRLALDVLKAKTGNNAVVSTLLVRFPLCKLASVATGEAKKELLSVLGLRNDKAITTCYTEVKEMFESLKHADLTEVNKIYVNYTNNIRPDFMANSSFLYGIDVEKVGFNLPLSAMTFINRWIETATYMRIRDVINKDDIDKSTSMMFVSAAHFKGTWEFAFDPKMTTNKKFHHYNRKMITMPMISNLDDYAYYDDEANDFKMATINLGSMGSAVTYIVPNNAQDLPRLLEKLHKNPNLLTNNKKIMKLTPLRIYLPWFKIKTLVDWTDFFKLIGLRKIFNTETSGLENILKKTSNTKHIYLSKAKQKIFLDMDDLGVVRNGPEPAREFMMSEMTRAGFAMPEFVVDRPFYFIISLSLRGANQEVFNGVYYGPEE